MSKRKEKFCDMRVEESIDKAPHPLAIDGRCVEPAEGTCSRCQGDYCTYHGGRAYVVLYINYAATKQWPIPLCKGCSESIYEQFCKRNILPPQLERGFHRLSQETAQWLGKKGSYAPKEKPKPEKPEPESAN